MYLAAIWIMLFLCLLQHGCPTRAQFDSNYNYKEVLQKSILFYEAQRSGKLPANNRVRWRGDSALHDHGDEGQDLSGGYFDSGSHVKNTFVQASTIALLSWGLIEYKEAYEKAGQMKWMLESIKWGLDYFLKCSTDVDPTSYELYALVGEPAKEHSIWGRPEEIPCCRSVFKVNMTHPGSDAAAETAAALAAGSMVFKQEDPCYSNKLLQGAKDLFNFANFTRGKYSDVIEVIKGHRDSHSADDEIVWGALWMYMATGNKQYLSLAEREYSNKLPWAFDWDDKNGGYQLLLYKLTNKAKYRDDIIRHLDNWLPTGDIPYTKKGLAFRGEWGSLRYAANTAYLALVAADMGIKPTVYRQFAIQQIHYILGDTGRSFVVGFGENPPVQPHHEAASCDPDKSVPCGWSQYSAPGPNPNVIYGALVGGPDINDTYVDIRSDYKQNEVTIDYNAGFQSAIAGLFQLSNAAM